MRGRFALIVYIFQESRKIARFQGQRWPNFCDPLGLKQRIRQNYENSDNKRDGNIESSKFVQGV